MNNAPEEEQDRGLGEAAIEAYDRIVERVYRSVNALEEGAWPLVQEKVREAAELELAAEELTREELDLLSAYVARDLREMGRIAHVTGASIAALLRFDLNALESRVVDMFSLLADPALVDQTELQQRLDHGPETYLSGEVAAVGRLRCMACERESDLTETRLLEPCSDCGGRYFERL